LSFFKKPVDLRSEDKPVHLPAPYDAQEICDETRKLNKEITWYEAINLALAPVVWLFKFMEYIHLLFFAIFGGLSLYFGLTGLPTNSWAESILLICVGIVLLGWPVASILEKRR
jgi:hypothetical protein